MPDGFGPKAQRMQMAIAPTVNGVLSAEPSMAYADGLPAVPGASKSAVRNACVTAGFFLAAIRLYFHSPPFGRAPRKKSIPERPTGRECVRL